MVPATQISTYEHNLIAFLALGSSDLWITKLSLWKLYILPSGTTSLKFSGSIEEQLVKHNTMKGHDVLKV